MKSKLAKLSACLRKIFTHFGCKIGDDVGHNLLSVLATVSKMYWKTIAGIHYPIEASGMKNISQKFWQTSNLY